VQLFVSLGQLAANLILKGTGELDSALAYKIPLALQLFFPVCILIRLPFCPESPWFLVQKAKLTEALAVFERLGYPSQVTTLAEVSKQLHTKRPKMPQYPTSTASVAQIFAALKSP
jgi:SP family general alpha glucoside:H+ symporter-like MFS transporter